MLSTGAKVGSNMMNEGLAATNKGVDMWKGAVGEFKLNKNMFHYTDQFSATSVDQVFS